MINSKFPPVPAGKRTRPGTPQVQPKSGWSHAGSSNRLPSLTTGQKVSITAPSQPSFQALQHMQTPGLLRNRPKHRHLPLCAITVAPTKTQQHFNTIHELLKKGDDEIEWSRIMSLFAQIKGSEKNPQSTECLAVEVGRKLNDAHRACVGKNLLKAEACSQHLQTLTTMFSDNASLATLAEKAQKRSDQSGSWIKLEESVGQLTETSRPRLDRARSMVQSYRRTHEASSSTDIIALQAKIDHCEERLESLKEQRSFLLGAKTASSFAIRQQYLESFRPTTSSPECVKHAFTQAMKVAEDRARRLGLPRK